MTKKFGLTVLLLLPWLTNIPLLLVIEVKYWILDDEMESQNGRPSYASLSEELLENCLIKIRKIIGNTFVNALFLLTMK